MAEPFQLHYGVPDEQQLAELGALVKRTFQLPEWAPARDRIGASRWRVLRAGPEVLAGCGFYEAGQFFGGRSIQCAPIAAVAVRPEARGRRVGLGLMTGLLRELRERGTPLASLYATVPSFYRKLGFELAGESCWLTAPLAHIGLRDRSSGVRRLPDDDWSALHRLYRGWAASHDGLLDRGAGLWQRRRDAQRFGSTPEAFVVGPVGAATGGVVLAEERVGEKRRLNVVDLVATDEATLRALWTLVADHRTMVDDVGWVGPLNDLRAAVWRQPEWSVRFADQWLLRVVDLPAALAGRGYRVAQRQRLVLEVEDAVLPGNQGRWLLSVEDGVGVVEPVSEGVGDVPALQLHVRVLAPLFTGMYAPKQLAGLGWLRGNDDAIGIAHDLFAGPRPWMAEHV